MSKFSRAEGSAVASTARSMDELLSKGDDFQHPVIRNPLPDPFPGAPIHQIGLPLPDSTDVGGPAATQVYLIEDDPLTLIDTGVCSPQSAASLHWALGRLGFQWSDISRVIVTHAHRDHFGLMQMVRQANEDVECWAHEDDAETIESFDSLMLRRVDGEEQLFRELGVPHRLGRTLRTNAVAEAAAQIAEAHNTQVDRLLVHDDRVEWKDWSLRVFHSPGHTPGHILLEDEARGILFSGDQVMNQAIPRAENFYVNSMPDPRDRLGREPRFRGLVEMRRSLRWLRGRPYALVLPGYGQASRQVDRMIRDTLLYYEVRIQRIERSLRRLAAMGQDVTAFEIWKAMFPGNASASEIRAQLFLVIGALDCLEEDGVVEVGRRAETGEGWTYSYR